jgi:hypothetical protein
MDRNFQNPGGYPASHLRYPAQVTERAIKAVSGLQGTTYAERLKLQSVQERRAKADLILTYTILSDSDREFSAQWLERAATRRPTMVTTGLHHNLLPQSEKHEYRQGCGSGLIQYGSGSGSSIFPQSGSTKFLNPDPIRIRIHKGKFENKFFF